MNTDKFSDGDFIVKAMNLFLRLMSFCIALIFLFPFMYTIGEFVANLVNILFAILAINVQTNWLGVWGVVLAATFVFYLITGRYKNVYFRSWASEDRDGCYQDFELHL